MKKSKKVRRVVLGEGYVHPELWDGSLKSTQGVTLWGIRTLKNVNEGSWFGPRRCKVVRFRGKKIRLVAEVLTEDK